MCAYLQEQSGRNADKPCDTGCPVSELLPYHPSVDLSEIDDLFPAKKGPYIFTREAVKQRGINAKLWLKSRPEVLIIVVTHSAFLRTAVVGRRFANADFQLFSFSSHDVDSVEMVEDELTDGTGEMARSQKGDMADEAGDFPDA